MVGFPRFQCVELLGKDVLAKTYHIHYADNQRYVQDIEGRGYRDPVL